MRKKFISVVIAVIVCLTFSGCTIQRGTLNRESVKYTMYIGLNDKDTYTQLVTYEEAEKKVRDIALKYVDGFTVLSARGAYKDEKGVITHENSLFFEFSSATDRQIKGIMDEVLKKLNQNSILVEKQKVNREFYEGKK
jgi:hypothetical protein